MKSQNNTSRRAFMASAVAAAMIGTSSFAMAHDDHTAQPVTEAQATEQEQAVETKLDTDPKFDGMAVIKVDTYQHPIDPINGDLVNDVVLHNEDGMWVPKGVAATLGPLSPSTYGHETVHGINGDLNRKYKNDPLFSNPLKFRGYKFEYTLGGVQGMYLGEGKAAIVKTPKGVGIDDLARNIPSKLRGSAYDTYLSRPMRANAQNEGGRVPIYLSTYILDEASAFALDAKMAMELHDDHPFYKSLRDGPNKGRRAETQGAGEFVNYLIAFGDIIDRNPSAYSDPKDKAIMMASLKYMIEDLATSYKLGLDTDRYPTFANGRRDYLDLLENDPSAAHLRRFATKQWGADWLKNIISADPKAPAQKPANENQQTKYVPEGVALQTPKLGL